MILSPGLFDSIWRYLWLSQHNWVGAPGIQLLAKRPKCTGHPSPTSSDEELPSRHVNRAEEEKPAHWLVQIFYISSLEHISRKKSSLGLSLVGAKN